MTAIEPQRLDAIAKAVLLGLLQGPTEIAPVSSSAHTSLARAALGGAQEDPSLSKSLDVALHGGSAIALSMTMAGRLRRSWGRLAVGTTEGASTPQRTRAAGSGSRRLAILALSLAPPAAIGYLLERPIERRLSGPRANATGLALGSIAMAIADRAATGRTLEDADLPDGLALGVAQAAALIPGVSRRGATLTAARFRGMSRQDADELSWLTALPVIAGACALKAVRLSERDDGRRETGGDATTREVTGQLIAGAGTSLVATLISARALRSVGKVRLLWFATYRLALAGVAVRTRGNARGSAAREQAETTISTRNGEDRRPESTRSARDDGESP